MAARRRRPAWFTAEAEEQILELVRAGNTITTAAAAAGVDPASLYEWASSSDSSDKVLAAFMGGLRQARAAAEARMVEALTTDAVGGFLVRKYTKVYPNGDEETDESFAPPNGRIGLEWLKRRNGSQWGDPEMPSDMLGGAGPSGAADKAVEAGTIAALARRVRSLLDAAAADDDAIDPGGQDDEGDEAPTGAVPGQVLPPDSPGA